MRFLILKTSALGDIVQSYEALCYLRAKVKEARIEWVVEKQGAPLVQRHLFVDETHVIDTKAWRKGKDLNGLSQFFKTVRKRSYDAIFDLQGNLKSSLLLLFLRSKDKVGFAKGAVSESINLFCTTKTFLPKQEAQRKKAYLGLVASYFNENEPSVEKGPLLTLSDEEEKQLDALCLKPDPILICPFSRWKNKEMTHSSWALFLKQVEGSPYILFGTEEERKQAEALASICSATLLPKCSLPLLQHVMKRFKTIYSCDSLPLHLAETIQDVPIVSFFGPSKASCFAPMGTHHKSFQGRCPYKVEFSVRCPYLRSCKEAPCIRDIRF